MYIFLNLIFLSRIYLYRCAHHAKRPSNPRLTLLTFPRRSKNKKYYNNMIITIQYTYSVVVHSVTRKVFVSQVKFGNGFLWLEIEW